MSDEAIVKKRAAVGSRERIEQLGPLAKQLIDECVFLLEHHVPDADERANGLETRRPLVISASKALDCFQEGWRHIRDAHGGRG